MTYGNPIKTIQNNKNFSLATSCWQFYLFTASYERKLLNLTEFRATK